MGLMTKHLLIGSTPFDGRIAYTQFTAARSGADAAFSSGLIDATRPGRP
jgi:hypothetical protein